MNESQCTERTLDTRDYVKLGAPENAPENAGRNAGRNAGINHE